MAEAPRTKLWRGRGMYLLIVSVLIFVRLLPMDTAPPNITALGIMPDIILLVTMVWVARRPDYVPALSIVSVMLLTDLLFQRPPGLWAALVLLLSEMLRSRANDIRNLPFALEWLGVAVGIIIISVANHLILSITAVPQAGLTLHFIEVGLTCASYPLIVVIAHFIFGVTRPAPGEVDALGHRL